MQVLIKQTAARWGGLNAATGKKVHNFLIENRGKWLSVDTDHLFNNQYNVDGFRIHDTDIQAVINDPRKDLAICKYCGEMIHETEPHLKEVECSIYGLNYLKESFFINHPNGNDAIKEINLYLDHKKTGVYCFSSVNGQYYRISRRKNIEFVLAEGVPYIVGIGYTHYKKAGLTANEVKILFNCIELINNQ